MPTAVIDVPAQVNGTRKLWTRAEFDELSSSGVLAGQKLELIAGELISKMGKGRPHVNAIVLLQGWLVEVFGRRFVNPEAPIDVAPKDNPTNEPQPDLIVLARDISHFTRDDPRPQDLQLVVEIADTTLGFDLTTKAGLYARAGIVEYWVLDVAGRRLIVHREPRAGRYGSIIAYGDDESVAPLAAPTSLLRIRDVFVD